MQNLDSSVRIRLAPLFIGLCLVWQGPLSLTGCQTQAPRADHLHWAPRSTPGERALLLDAEGLLYGQMLDPHVTTVLNDRFVPIRLDPKTNPSLANALGTPTLTFLDPDGCVRATATLGDELIAVSNRVLQMRHAAIPGDCARTHPLEEPR